MTTGIIEGKRNRVKKQAKMSDGLTKYLNVGRVTGALRALKDRDAWKVMIAYP